MVPVKLRSYEMIEEENKELKTMMRKLCHEMGNALTLLGGSIFYLEHDLRMKESVDDLANIKNDYTYICKLFNNLREYNHTEAVQKENIKISQLVEHIVDVFDKLNTENAIELHIEQAINDDTANIYGDITKFRQVIVNILKNSSEAMEENEKDKGKNIIVRLTIETVPEYVCSNEAENVNGRDVVHIELRDNGKGIPEKNLNDIFQPLYTFGKKQGSGLGLAVVKKIIEDHSGEIKAVSAEGTGTAMHIYLPVSSTCVYE